ncbi:ABC transporter permease [Flavobacteriaceae bacterium]|jgi:lipoprotein-releasing system permease protein|nr:ABC transporter permease [Flavobacteriaceae bacterium]
MRQHEQYKNTVSSRIINIAMTAVAIGIASILIAMACSKGLQNEIRNKTSAFNGHILITLFENNESQVSILPFENSQEIKNKIEAHNNFDRMHAIALKAGMLKANDDFEGILLKGVDSGFKWTSIEGFLTQGDFPAYGSNSSNEILMSEVIANRLNLKVGDTVDAFFQNNLNEGLPKRRKFKIVGLFFSGFPDIDENLVYADLRQVQRLNQWNENQIGGYEVFVKSFSQVSQTSNQLYAGLPSELNSISISDRFSSIFQWITLFDFNVLIILIVMLLVGVINMATALLVLILERSRMVGLLKAIGAPDSMIQKIFMYNGIVIMSKGMFYGNLIGFTFYYSQLQWGWISLDPATYFVSVAPVSIAWFEALFLNLIFLGLATLLLWIPSKIVLKISPSQVLRFR